MSLVPCPACRRHVDASESACPHCRTSFTGPSRTALRRAAALSAGLAVFGAGLGCAYGGEPGPYHDADAGVGGAAGHPADAGADGDAGED